MDDFLGAPPQGITMGERGIGTGDGGIGPGSLPPLRQHSVAQDLIQRYSAEIRRLGRLSGPPDETAVGAS